MLRLISIHPIYVVLVAGLLAAPDAYAQVGANGEIEGLTAKFVDINGVKTRYYDYGRGEAIVLVTGGSPGFRSGGANVWSRNIRGLAEKFRVLAVDPIGMGMTGAPEGERAFDIESQIEHLYQFMRTLNVDKAHLVGLSAGGANVLALAVAHPDIVKSLTWASGGAEMRTSPSRMSAMVAKCPQDEMSLEYQKCRTAARAPLSTTFSEEYEKAAEFMWNLPTSIEIRKRLGAPQAAGRSRDGARRTYLARVREQVRGGALQVPVLLYGGKQDAFDWDADAPHAYMRGAMEFFDTFGAKNPKVKSIVVNGASHFVPRDQAAQFNADLIQFIDYWNRDSHRQPTR